MIAVPAIPAATKGKCVARAVRLMAATSSAPESAMLEAGSGLGVTRMRAAVLEVCARAAMAAPAAVARSCISGESCEDAL